MTRKDYHALTARQYQVLDALINAPPDGIDTKQLSDATGLTVKQARITAEGLRNRGRVLLFTYRGGTQVWRIDT